MSNIGVSEPSSTNTSKFHELYELHKNDQDEAVIIDAFDEHNPNAWLWIKHYFENPLSKTMHYFIDLFPITKWILHYNLSWLYADLVAGITVGIVMVPQSMSYAQIAGLSSQYGLYSGFVGAFIYCFFATSKDVCIGPVAVMSLETAKVIERVQSKYPELEAPIIATSLAFICGVITIGIGLLRLGFILEFISIPAVMGFMSGSAFNILWGQVPALMGYNSEVNTRASTYKVVVNSLKHLPDTKLDAVFGLIPLFILYVWKWGCNYGDKKFPKFKVVFFFLQALKNGVVIVVFTLISWGITRHHKKEKRISLLGTVPSGLNNTGLMDLPDGILRKLATEIPASAIVLLLEHISIAKSFGRVNDYKIVPDQELVAIGATNLIGTFFNAYPATGSFSRTALKAKCNVKTPISGLFTGACVILALYCLTDAFYYIPKATLSAVIIHAVTDLIASYQTSWSFWRVAPIDAGIFFIAVILTVFTTIEIGIYFAICASCAVLLFNVAFPNGTFLGRVKVAEVVNPIIRHKDEDETEAEDNSFTYEQDDVIYTEDKKSPETRQRVIHKKENNLSKKFHIKYHTRWIPINKTELNKELTVLPPPPGVLVYRPTESWAYLNCSKQYDQIYDGVKKFTRKGKTVQNLSNFDRPWNDPGPLKFPWSKKTQEKVVEDTRPVLKILAFDFTTVSHIDSTGVQNLVDLRKAVNKYADREVEFHFAGILSPWIRRALVNAGFGTSLDDATSVTYVNIVEDEESALTYLPAIGTNTPFFHLELPTFSYLDREESEPIDDFVPAELANDEHS